MAEDFTPTERDLLARYVTDPDGRVFGLVNLPEVVKGALFARYSRYGGGLKRLFLDEFAGEIGPSAVAATTGTERADRLYQTVFSEYGDDSVAQLGGAHVAMEGISNLLTKQIEWGRLAAYLEQSTRYIRYDTPVARPDGSTGYRYYTDPDVLAGPHGQRYVETLDAIFDIYSSLIDPVLTWVRATYPQDATTSDRVYRSATKAKALDLLRGLLPAATTSNLGMFATGQAYEQLLLRLRASELAESHEIAALLLAELRKIIPAFLTRVDREDRGVAWSDYLAARRSETRALARSLIGDETPAPADLVTLVDYAPRDPLEAEIALATAALYPHTRLPEEQLHDRVAALSADERQRVVDAYVGERRNRRHRPGRGLERVWYRFDVLGDYGGFRDLQRHRMLTIEWQELTPAHGYETPPELEDAGVADRWHEALERSAELYGTLAADHPVQAQYAVCFAYRVRYTMQLNARAAMQMIELRSTPQGHPAYRRIVQEMYRLIADEAKHTAVAAAMQHVDLGAAELERLESEKAAERRRAARGAS